MSTVTWRFHALDTWFFRESRPHGAIGGAELDSLFPPPARTLVGAVRTLLGERAGVDWQAYADTRGAIPAGGKTLRDLIGFGDDLGPLRCAGPWLTRVEDDKTAERLYPAPLFLAAKTEAGGPGYHRLAIGPAVDCDLGRVRLPVLAARGAKILDEHWLTGAGYARVLAGGLPEPAEVVKTADLLHREPRLGIARANARRTVEAGLLYQTRHIRPRIGEDGRELAVELDLSGVAPEWAPLPARDRVRLGGEGRLALVATRTDTPPLPAAPRPSGQQGLVLVLLSHALLEADAEGGWLPPAGPGGGADPTLWRGRLKTIPLTCHAAVLGKAVREGGWDLAARRPRPVRSLIPTGSAWFCTVDDGDMAAALAALHGQAVGKDTELGRGLLAVGLWNDHAPKENTQ